MSIIHDFFPDFFGSFLTKQLGQILENFVFLLQIQLILFVLETAQILF